MAWGVLDSGYAGYSAATMLLFLLRRAATFAATLIVASLVVFAVLEWLPGSPAQVMLGDTATPESIAALEARLGLDRPAWVRYASWIGGLLRGDSATSYAYDTPTFELIAERLQVSLPLALLAMALTVLVALALGVYAASRHNRAGDVGVMALSQLGVAVPSFWLAILLILLFAVQLQWVSAGGFPGWSGGDGGGEGGIWPGLKALLLPALSLAAVQAAILARVTRSAVLEAMREDYVRTARAKGLSRRAVLWRHVLRNAMIPVITIMGLQFANLITGAIVVENVFVLPGIGRLVFQAINNRDLVLVRDVVMLLAAVVVVINFVVDVLYALIDPRHAGGRRCLNARRGTPVSWSARCWSHCCCWLQRCRCCGSPGRRPRSTSRTSWPRRPQRTGSAPTAWGATSPRSCSSAARTPSSSASSRSASV